MTPEMLLQYLGIYTDSKRIEDLSFTANIVLPEASYVLVVVDGVILYEQGSLHDEADVTWWTTRDGLFAIAKNNPDAIAELVTQEGDTTLLDRLLEANTVHEQTQYFNIIEP
jgi:alkyl sulfatase BDS1-like metallo-beta-lactamase superfamily hydrolase